MDRTSISAAVRRFRPAVIELSLTVVAIVVYFLIRASHPDDIPASVQRSLAIVRIEGRLGIFREAAIQDVFLAHDWAIEFANTVYVWGMYPVMAAIGVWLAVRDLSRFRYVRNVMLVSACMGIVGYWLVPTAPPRLMADYGYQYGFVDTLHRGTSAVKDYQPSFFVNHYAAIPSFHFAWVALSSVALWMNTRNLTLRVLAVTISLLMFWAILVTANHYFLDLVIGVATVAGAWAVTEALYRLANRGRRRRRSATAHPQAPPEATGVSAERARG